MDYKNAITDSRLMLGLNIKQVRRDQKLSQAQLGLMIGRDRSYISRIERGRCNATFETILLIASGLGISPSEMLAGIGEPDYNGDASLPVSFSMPKGTRS